jgi:hypothetical protein
MIYSLERLWFVYDLVIDQDRGGFVMRYVTFFTLLLLVQFLPAQAPDTMWTRLYGDGVGYCVIETSDSGYVIVGYTKYGWWPGQEGGGDVLLQKTNKTGEILWTKTFGDTNHDDAGYSVRQTSDGGYIIVGTTSSFGAGWMIFG